MIIYNTTFQVSNAGADEFLNWLRTIYVPQALSGGELSCPQLARVMANRDDGSSYALQFRVESLSVLQRWNRSTGKGLRQRLATLFGDRVTGFSTMLDVIDL